LCRYSQDIQDMKEQIKEMDHELERYHKNNANLDLTISVGLCTLNQVDP
jgi:hypothetical protein